MKLTVSDGKGGTATRDIPVQVLAADNDARSCGRSSSPRPPAFRHDSIPTGIAAIQTLGTQKNWQVDATEDASLFTDAVLEPLRRRDLHLDDG